ncbi:MAG: hypothetical protein RIC80_08505 [Cyclobacteriaceae bacterium]
MIISASKPLPGTSELYALLKEKFPGRQIHLIQGLGNTESILVRKSSLVGVQITSSDNQIRVDGSFPSIFTSLLATIALCGGFWVPLYFSWIRFEKEISSFLVQRFS